MIKPLLSLLVALLIAGSARADFGGQFGSRFVQPYPVFIASISGSIAADATESENYPTGTKPGNLVVLMVSDDNNLSIASPNDAGWTTAESTIGPAMSYAIYWHIAGSETSVSVTDGLDSTQPTAVLMYTFANADPANPINVGTEVTGASGDPDPPSVTPVQPLSMILAVGAVDDDNVTSVTAPTNYSNCAFAAAGGGAAATSSVVACIRFVATAAAENPGILVNSGDDEWIAQTVSIK